MAVKINPAQKQTRRVEVDINPGYPAYAADEDIYEVYQKGEEIDPEDILHTKAFNTNNKDRTKEILTKRSTESDLDIPGGELDDLQEEIGSEDEENNYYSIGGEDHSDLDEYQEE